MSRFGDRWLVLQILFEIVNVVAVLCPNILISVLFVIEVLGKLV